MENTLDSFEGNLSDTPIDELTKKRPLGITILSVLYVLSNILMILLLFSTIEKYDDSFNFIFNINYLDLLIAYSSVMIPIISILTYGLLTAKEWARYTTIIFQYISIISSIITLNIIRLLFSVYLIYYLKEPHVKKIFNSKKPIKSNVKFLIIVISILFISLSLSIATYNNPIINFQNNDLKNEQIFTASLEDIILTEDDILDIFEFNASRSSEQINNKGDILEWYVHRFTTINISDAFEYQDISISLTKYNTTERAIKVVNGNLEKNMQSYTSSQIKIGDESYTWNEGEEESLLEKRSYSIYFRVANVVCSLDTWVNYSYTYELARIVEQRIYESTE